MIINHIKPDDCVLELGGSCGRSACIINHILSNKEKHVVIEPSANELHVLTLNRDTNNYKFQIENSAISGQPLFSRDWQTYNSHVPGSVPVKVITYRQLKDK